MHLQVGEGLETGAQETKSGSEGGGGDNKAQEGLWLWKGAELELDGRDTYGFLS